MDYILVYSPQKIILWGGVMHQERLFTLVREKVKVLLNGYIPHDMVERPIEEYMYGTACAGRRYGDYGGGKIRNAGGR